MTKRQEKGDIFTPEMDEETESQSTCPNCQMPKDEWSDAEGYEKESVLYCCEGCAENVGCTCGDEEMDENELDDDKESAEDSTVEDTSVPDRDAGI